MKKILINIKRLLPVFLLALTVTSCLKDKDYEDGLYGAIRNTEGGMYLSLRTAGLANVQKSGILINPSSPDYDTVDVFVDLDLSTKSTSDITVKVAIDDAKRVAYNTANNKNFLPVTSDMVKLSSNTITIPAGQRFAKTTFIIKQDLFDPVKSYMFPIVITEAPEKTLSSNLNIKYSNIIGNPFAGASLHTYKRWNKDNNTGAPGSGWVDEPVTILPVTETTFSIESGYYKAARYQVSFTNTNGVYSDFTVELHPDDVKVMNVDGITITAAPKVIKADPLTKEFVLRYIVFNGSAYRYIEDTYHQ